MFYSISFYLGKDTIVVGEESFPLGELSAGILNLSPDEYRQMKKEMTQVTEYRDLYVQTEDIIYWEKALQTMKRLDDMLCGYALLQLLKQKPDVLRETEKLLEKYQQSRTYNFRFDEQKVKQGWENFDRLCAKYYGILFDIAAFNQTIRNFIRFSLRNLKKLNASTYANALANVLGNYRLAEKLVANSMNSDAIFTNREELTLRFIPRPVEEDSETFEIFEYYEAGNLQTLLKMDFYRGLRIGHVVRRCEYCGRYFLLTKGYHTKYCDQPNPQNPQYTCAQLGYRQTGQKEKAKDDPMKQSLWRCYQRLNKDVSRDRLTSQERDVLYAMAQDLHFEARRDPHISFEEFDKMLATKELCRRCGIERKDGKAGKPKHDK